MTWRLVGVGLALFFYAALWVCVLAGARSLVAPLVVFPVIVLLIAGGNWLQHWLGIERRAQQFSRPGTDAEPDDTGRAQP